MRVTGGSCSCCGGPLVVSSGQTMIFPTIVVSMGPDDPPGCVGRVIEVRDNAWCGPCVAAMNEAMGAGDV